MCGANFFLNIDFVNYLLFTEPVFGGALGKTLVLKDKT